MLNRLSKASDVEVENDPDLSSELSRQYEATKTDNEFKKVTHFCKEMMENRLKNVSDKNAFLTITASDFDN